MCTDARATEIPEEPIGYDFTIVYRPGKNNIIADALSKRERDDTENTPELNLLSAPISSVLQKIRKVRDSDQDYRQLRASILTRENVDQNYTIRRDMILYKDTIVVPNNQEL